MEKTFKGYTIVRGKGLHEDYDRMGYFGKKKDCEKEAEHYINEGVLRVVKATLVVEFG